MRAYHSHDARSTMRPQCSLVNPSYIKVCIVKRPNRTFKCARLSGLSHSFGFRVHRGFDTLRFGSNNVLCVFLLCRHRTRRQNMDAGGGNAPPSILAYETRVGLSQPAIIHSTTNS